MLIKFSNIYHYFLNILLIEIYLVYNIIILFLILKFKMLRLKFVCAHLKL